MEAKEVEELKLFVDLCKKNPSMLHFPSLSFFNNFLQSLGAQIPQSGNSGKAGVDNSNKKQSDKSSGSNDVEFDDNLVESDVELDNSDVMEPENDPPAKMGDLSTEITEENQEASGLLKAKAIDAICEGQLNDAIDHLTAAIMLNPVSILYASRASAFIKLKKPKAAIRDADAALQINPDSARGYKARGTARAMLGLWEEAAHDLRVASTLDFDEEIGVLLRKVESNANKIVEHRRKYDRLRKERELKKVEIERQKSLAKQTAEAASLLKDGEVIGIHSTSELKSKLNAASKSSRLAIIYFTATWCGPCRYVSPVFTSLAGKYPKSVFLKVDIDKAGDAAAEWNVSSVPAFFFVKNGKEVDTIVGADKNALEKKIAQHSG